MYEKTQKILPEEKLQAKKIPFREGLYQSLFILFFATWFSVPALGL